MSYRQLRSYGDGSSVCSLIRKTRDWDHLTATIVLGHPKPKKMLIFRFVGIFEYIILLMLILLLDMCQNS